jgi:hypothetical protein
MAYKKFNNSTLRYTTMPWLPFGGRKWAEKVLGNASEVHDKNYEIEKNKILKVKLELERLVLEGKKKRKEFDKSWLKQVKENARQESGYFEKFTIYLAGVVGYAIIKTFGGLWWKR